MMAATAITIRLLSDQVLIEETPVAELKIGSIYLPDMRDDARGFSKHQDCALLIGTVVATGPGERCQIYQCRWCGLKKTLLIDEGRTRGLGKCKNCDADKLDLIATGHLPMDCKVGDRVVYPHRAGNEVTLDGRPYRVMHEEQFVFGVLEEN